MSSERSLQVAAADAKSASLELVTERLRLRLFQAGDLPASVSYRSESGRRPLPVMGHVAIPR